MAEATVNKKSRNTDLTSGNIWVSVIKFAIPLMIGQLFQTFYHSVDSIVVGHFVSSDALGAVNASSSVSGLVVQFFNGLSVGLGIVFGINYGAKNYKKLHDSIHTAITTVVIFGLILAVFGSLSADWLIKIVDVDADIEALSTDYLRVYMFGVFFTALYNTESSVIRSLGDSRGPLYYLVASSVLNVILDLLFVAVFGWGVVGVAWATVIAQGLSVVLATYRLMHLDPEYALNVKEMKIDWKVFKELLYFGLPSAIQSSISSIAGVFTSKWENSFGKYATSGIGSGKKIDQFAGIPSTAIGNAIPAFVAQNVGAGKYERAEEGVNKCFILTEVILMPISIVIYFFAPQLATVFTDDPNVVEVIAGFLHTVMPLYFFMGTNHLFAGAIRGFGKSTESMILNLTGNVLFRQLYLAIALNINHDINLMYWCYPATWISSSLFCFVYYWFFIRKKIKNGTFEYKPKK